MSRILEMNRFLLSKVYGRSCYTQRPMNRLLASFLSAFDVAAEPIERRSLDRMAVPRCPHCYEKDRIRVKSRSAYAVYFNCRRCGEMIILPKPRR